MSCCIENSLVSSLCHEKNYVFLLLFGVFLATDTVVSSACWAPLCRVYLMGKKCFEPTVLVGLKHINKAQHL